MADNSESIGGISVSIDGDYSPLQEAIQEATQDAQAGGEQIAGALNAGAAGADNLASAISQATSNLSNFSGAAETAATGIESAAGGVLTFEQQIQALIDTGSTLAEALNTVQSQAETMAGALDSAASSASTAAEQLSLFDEAATVPYADAVGQLNLFATELEPIGTDADTAAGGLNNLNDAINQVPPAADGAKNSLNDLNNTEEESVSATEAIFGALQDLGNQFLALAEAFEITKGLKEFGAEALEASDSIKTATISLTQLTGSAEDAETTIGGLEKLGMSDGLAMPSLLSAATRMQAMLGPTADVDTILGQLANSAAVMGKSIDAVSNSFDRMVLSGNTNARTLSTMGLSLDALGKSAVQLGLASDAADAQMKGWFKDFDQSDRISILTGALQNLSGIAQDVAQNTFGGQWQQLANQWEQIMVEAGNAILPVISGLTNLMKVDILPWIKGIVDGFNQLSGPTQTTIVEIGLVAAAIPVVTLALGTFGLALSGLGEVAEVATGLLAALGVTSGEVAVEEGVAAAATAAMGVAATEAAVGEGVAAGALETLGAAAATMSEETVAGAATAGAAIAELSAEETTAAGVATAMAAEEAGVAAEMGTLGGAMATATTAIEGIQAAGAALLASPLFTVAVWVALGAAILDAANAWWQYHSAQEGLDQSESTLAHSVQVLQVALEQQGISISDLKSKYDSGQISLTAYLQGLNALVVAHNNAAPAVANLTTQMSLSQAAAQGAEDHQTALGRAINTTGQALINAEMAWEKGTGSVEAASKAYVAYEAALNAANKTTQAAVEPITSLQKATHDYVDSMQSIPNAASQAANATIAQSSSVQALSDTLQRALASQNVLTQSFINAQNAQLQAKAAIDGSQQSYTNYQSAVLNTEIAQNKLNAASATVVSSQKALDAATNQTAQDQKTAGGIISDVVNNVLKPMPATLNILNTDMVGLGVSAKGMGVNMNDAMSILGSVGVQVDGVSKKTAGLITAYQELGQASNATLPENNSLWAAFDSQLAKVATTDLPAVIALYNTQISRQQQFGDSLNNILQTQNQLYAVQIKEATAQGDLQKAADLTVQSLQNQYDTYVKMNEPLGAQLNIEAQLLQAQITRATNAQQDANDEVVELNNVKIAQQNLITQTQGWGLIQVGVTNDIINGLSNVGQSISQVIVEGGKMSTAFIKIGQQIAETILTTIINGGMKMLIAEIDGPLLGAMTSFGNTAVKLGSNIDAMFGGVQKAVVDTGVIAGNTAVDLGNNVDQVVAGVAQTSQTASTGTAAAATAANAAVLSSTMMTVGAISSLIGALAGIVGDIEIARTNTLLGKIEVSTRETDAKATDITSVLYDVLNQGWQVWNEAIPAFQYMSDMLLEIDSDIIYLQHLMQTTAGLSADTLVPGILTDIQGVLENSILGELKVIDSDLNAMGTGILTKIADLIGNDLLGAVTSGFTAVVEALTGVGGSGGSGLQMPPGGGVSSPGSPASIQPAASVSSSVSSNSNSVVNSGGNTTNNISVNISGGDPQATSSAIMTMLKQLIPQFSKASS